MTKHMLHAVRLARMEMMNGAATEAARRKVLAEASSAGVTNAEYLRAHAILKTVGEDAIAEVLTDDAETIDGKGRDF